MKLDWLRADIASARRASLLLVMLLAGSMLANVALAGDNYFARRRRVQATLFRLWRDTVIVGIAVDVVATFRS